LTLAFKLVRARDQTHFPCEFGANPFSRFRDISYKSKKVTDSDKNRTLRSSLRAVIIVHMECLLKRPLMSANIANLL